MIPAAESIIPDPTSDAKLIHTRAHGNTAPRHSIRHYTEASQEFF